MEFPKLKKNLKVLRSSFEWIAGYSKKVVLSAGLLSLVSGTSAGQPKVPVNPDLSTLKGNITKYSTKYLLRSIARSLASLVPQHRSHSSHSSHRSHSSHYSSSGSGHSSHSSHASHYSASGTSAPTVRTAPSPPSVVSSRTRTTTSRVVLSDNFEDVVSRATQWRLGILTASPAFTDSQVTVAEQNGRLEIKPRADAATRSYNGYITVTPWDFTAAHARVEVPQTTEGTADTIFAVGTDSNNWYGFVVESGKLYMQSKVDGRKYSQSIPYDATDHRFWRLRHEATDNEMLWETSPDGETWTVRRTATPQIALKAMYISLGAGTYVAETDPGIAAFDNFKFVVHR